MSGMLMKSEINWIPLEIGRVGPTQGRCLAVMQVSGGSQSFNAVNAIRLLGRWMRMFTIPNQSSVAKAFQEFGEDGRMKPPAYYERRVDVMEALVKFTLLLRDHTTYLTSRNSERAGGVDARLTRTARSSRLLFDGGQARRHPIACPRVSGSGGVGHESRLGVALDERIPS